MREKAILVGVVLPHMNREEEEDHLDELERLTETAGGLVVDRIIQEKSRLDAAYFVGRGKAEEIASCAKGHAADLVIFDEDLSPAQARNLEKLIGARIVDRSGLILDIFARGARSREARTQVELAQLNYMLPRLARRWTHLSRQEGGIGGRGVGEQQIEIDRRLIRHRIARLKEDLQRIEQERDLRRQGRRGAIKGALIGYTNSGKSTLLNALTQAGAHVEDRLFATLDPLVRRFEVAPGLPLLLIDTVGFIRKLPHHLVASFRSTLEEAADADFLVHVVDISHPRYEDHIEVTRQVLAGLDMGERAELLVFNKIDRVLEPGILDRARRINPEAALISAAHPAQHGGLGVLRKRLETFVSQDLVERHVRLRAADGPSVARLYAMTQVLDAQYEDGWVDMTCRMSRARAIELSKMESESGAGSMLLTPQEDTPA